MPSFFPIAFIAFGGCVLAQLWWMRKIRIHLIAHHPKVMLEMSGSWMMPSTKLFYFALGKAHKKLGDPELSKMAITLRMIYLLAIAIWLLVVFNRIVA